MWGKDQESGVLFQRFKPIAVRGKMEVQKGRRWHRSAHWRFWRHPAAACNEHKSPEVLHQVPGHGKEEGRVYCLGTPSTSHWGGRYLAIQVNVSVLRGRIFSLFGRQLECPVSPLHMSHLTLIQNLLEKSDTSGVWLVDLGAWCGQTAFQGLRPYPQKICPNTVHSGVVKMQSSRLTAVDSQHCFLTYGALLLFRRISVPHLHSSCHCFNCWHELWKHQVALWMWGFSVKLCFSIFTSTTLSIQGKLSFSHSHCWNSQR
jgi:hypothetical protein